VNRGITCVFPSGAYSSDTSLAGLWVLDLQTGEKHRILGPPFGRSMFPLRGAESSEGISPLHSRPLMNENGAARCGLAPLCQAEKIDTRGEVFA
jgi:hypothetical protein